MPQCIIVMSSEERELLDEVRQDPEQFSALPPVVQELIQQFFAWEDDGN